MPRNRFLVRAADEPRIAYWGERPELFADISTGRNEQERAEKVLKWFICTLKGQYTVRWACCGDLGRTT